ncbi:MAG: 2-dehydropantoate 2-reductase [Gammaproteobacteria bacterium]|jgi:2-dehydropantoate 2-reductase
MTKRVFVIGAGAVGAYTGGHMARAGVDITFVDPWVENVEAMRTTGLELRGLSAQECCNVKVKAMTPDEFKAISAERPVDIGIISTKSFDTEWAAELLKPALADDGFVVSIQNCLNEDRIAAIVGPERVAGCIASTISVELKSPAFVQRNVPKRGASYTVFRCGELSGEPSARVDEFVKWLSLVDSAKTTTNLIGERWSKLTINASGNGLSACTGLDSRDMALLEAPRRLSIRLAAETIRVAQALGVQLETIKGFPPQDWVAAAAGDADAMNRIETATIESAKDRKPGGRPSMGQDIAKGRRTEIDYLNGLVVERGKELGIDTTANEGIVRAVRLVESGQVPQDPKNIDGI